MTEHQVKLFNWQLTVPNLKEYHTLKREIFTQHQYFIELNHTRPLIIDAGSHIGLSTLYFKRLFPQSTIISLEPHPQAFKLLTHNLSHNQITKVLPLNQALWPKKTKITLYTDPSNENWWSNTRIMLDSSVELTHTQTLIVPTVTLKELYDGVGETIDLLKLDVEGAEWDILFDSFAHFAYIDHYLIEFHPNLRGYLLDFCQKFPSSHQVTCYQNNQLLNPKKRHPGLVIVKADRLGL